MATAYTSRKTGPWANQDTWNDGASGYPGQASGDTATIANTHNVTDDRTTSAYVVATTVQSGGTLTIGANQSGYCYGTVTIDQGGMWVWTTGGTYTARTGACTINGTWTMNGTSANSKLTLQYNGNITIGATATVTLTGGTKTVAAQFAGAPTGTYTYVDDGAGGDVSGWAVNDLIGGRSASSGSTAAITADGGFAGGKHTYTCALSNTLQDNGRCVNVTRSVVLFGAARSSVTLTAGATVAISYVEHQDTMYVDNIGVTFTGCAWRLINGSFRADNIAAAATTLVDCAAHFGASYQSRLWSTSGAASAITMTRCYLLSSATGTTLVRYNDANAAPLVLTDCEVGCGIIVTTGTSYGPRAYLTRCFVWAGNNGMTVQGGTVSATQCCFSEDVGGNAAVNTTDIQVGAYSGTVYLDDCKLGGTTPVAVGTANSVPTVISTNHGQVSGARSEWQRYGTCTKATDADFTEGVCDQIDPSSATSPFRYSYVFRCDTGKTPTLTFNQKGSGTLGACTVTLGYQRCGLTGIATGGTITPDTDGGVSQHSVTFTGTTDLAGEVEVIINVLDSSSGVLSVADFAVSGAE